MSDFLHYPTIEDMVGETPLVRLQRIQVRHLIRVGKLEGNNPAGSVKDRPAMSMIREAEARGHIAPGDTLIEATSGNTGIALRWPPPWLSLEVDYACQSERGTKGAMRAYGAD